MDRYFFLQDATTVARLLLGNLLIRKINKKEIVVRIVETEAYMGIADSACHSYGGKRTNRTNAMYSIGGYSYVYMIYGMHYMFNVVTADKNNPQAVLIRSIEPISPLLGKKSALTNGPGKLTKFLNIDLTFNKVDLIGNNELFLQRDLNLDFNIVCSKRININYAQEDDINKLWRFYIKDNKFVYINENYLVTANGAEVFLQENLIFRHVMNYSLVKEILKIHKDNVDVNLYTFDTWYSNSDVKSPIMKHFIRDLGLNAVIGDLTALGIDSVSKIVYYCDDLGTLNKLENEIKNKDFQDIRVFFSFKDLLEITNVNAYKYNAIKNIAFLENIPLSDVLAFGDNNNDYEMLKNLGKGVLMKNANEFLKINLANNETTRFSNNEDGVAKFLIDFFELNIKYE